MFLATALAVGPSTLLFVTARSGDVGAIARTFGFARPVYRLGALAYGLGVVFGVLTAMSGSIDLTTPWLVTSYVLIILLISTNFAFERWTRRVDAAANGDAEKSRKALDALVRERLAGLSLAGMVLVTLAIVFVMVVKPEVLGS
jgi:hypothetical protein